jgi:hypothetical protein
MSHRSLKGQQSAREEEEFPHDSGLDRKSKRLRSFIRNARWRNTGRVYRQLAALQIRLQVRPGFRIPMSDVPHHVDYPQGGEAGAPSMWKPPKDGAGVGLFVGRSIADHGCKDGKIEMTR